MNEVTAHLTWDVAYPIPVLIVLISQPRVGEGVPLPALIDRVHLTIEHERYPQVCLAYDLRDTDGRLPLSALMQRTQVSPKVQRVAVIGACSRADEMAVLIMAAAKQIAYPIQFFGSYAQAVPFLTGTAAQAARPADRRARKFL